VTDAQSQLASAAWSAFRSPDPTAIERLLRGDCSALPFLAAALGRHLQQFPSVENGLSRTQRQILDSIAAGRGDPASLFHADRQLEPWIFLGYGAFLGWLRGLAECRQPLIEQVSGAYRLTQTGREVRGGRARWSEPRRALLPH
jgi:hypothetical protein